MKLILSKLSSLLLSFYCLGCFVPHLPTSEQQREALQQIDNGTLLLRERKLSEAEAAFSLSADLEPSAAALDGLGCVAFLKQDYSAAQAYFVAAYEFDQDYSNALANLALLYDTQGLEPEAEILYLRAIADSPEHFRARNNYAGLLMQIAGTAASKEATAELRKAAALVDHPIINANLEQLTRN